MAEKGITKEKLNNSTDFNQWLVLCFCFVVTLIFMFFFGINSPLHRFNPQCDYNWYITMGRGIISGKVPYRDLFDHKGPITYFVFAIAALFPNYQFVVWCIEIVCITLFVYFAYRIARKFLSCWLSLATIPLLTMVLSTNFCRLLSGSCVEELCLPIFAYGLLCFLGFLMDRRPATWRRSLALGICLGILFWVKFSMWEFFLMPMLIWLVINLVHRNFLVIVRTGLIMLAGVLLVTLPVLIYFGVNGALGELWQTYFQLNLGSYSGNYSGLTETEMIARRWKNALWIFTLGAYFMFAFVLGIVGFAIQYWRQKSGWLMLIAVIPTWLLVGFFCGFEHYYIPFFTYTILGVIYFVKLGVKLILYFAHKLNIPSGRLWVKYLVSGLFVIVCFFCALPFVLNLSEINRPRENYAPLVFADMVTEYKVNTGNSPTLFCYNMIDYGFYNAVGVVPNVKYYARSAFMPDVFPEMFEAFDETIRNQVCDFVVVRSGDLDEKKEFLLNYYDFYKGTQKESTINYSYFDDSQKYVKVKFIVLFRK